MSVLLFLAILVAPAFAGGAPPSDPGAQVVAVAEGVPITRAEFEQAAARKAPANGATLSREEKREVLDALVEEKLLYAEALRLGLDKDPKVQKVMVNTLLREQVYNTVRNSDFDEATLKAYYEAHRDEFRVPEKVQLKRILIAVTDARPDAVARAEAERIRRVVAQEPSRFSELATEHSEDPYRRRGGDVGFVAVDGKPGLDQAVVDRAFRLPVDGISEVFRTEEGYNVVMVAARREAVERTYEQMKGSVLRKVKNDKYRELYDAYVAERRAKAAVRVETGVLDAIVVTPRPQPAEGPDPYEDDGGPDEP